ncbi:MAG: GNAT family N-acetyltransferase [Saprospiraceae bacterium]
MEIKIIDYSPEHKNRWREINEAWINKSYVMEAIDHQHCSFPEESILATGGQILLAVVDGEIAGTVGLLKDDESTYEMIKMAVDERFRGHGIGELLCKASIERARSLNAALFYLFSNRKGSETAIRLYRRLGFVEVPLARQDFERADIQMEMRFK